MLQSRSVPTRAALASLLACALACNKTAGDDASRGGQPGGSALPGQTEADLDTPLATVDGTVITVREFQDRINQQSPYIRARYTSLEQKKEFLDNLIRFEVLAGEAFRRGLDKDPDVVRTMKQVMIQKLMKDQFENAIKPEDITEQEMRAFYDAHRDEYNKPEEVRVSAIVVKDAQTADKVAKLAKGEQGRTNKGFRELVAQYSVDDASKVRGGDLRYFARDTDAVDKAVVEAAFGLDKTGDVAGPIKGTDGRFYIIKKTGHRKALVKTFDEVKRQIQNRLYREKRTEAQKKFIEELRAKAKITIDEAALSKVRVDTSAPAGGPHGHGAPRSPRAPAGN
ncbi:MAG: peptidylprolyl isomerase [Deltaproteobacteria bacterium]|nr:MAG: peptidylprolyl isomerase [Deltaproteobacteria bacterium]